MSQQHNRDYHRKRQERKEEEEHRHLQEGYEYKILRFILPWSSRVPYYLDRESQFGWDLVEVLDHSRLRLRRKLSERDRDPLRQGNPYRVYIMGLPEYLMYGSAALALIYVFFRL